MDVHPPAGRAEGADNEWTHENANAGNTFASTDTLAVPPFGLLWYSGGIDRYFTPQFGDQHDRSRYPVRAAGRMFLPRGQRRRRHRRLYGPPLVEGHSAALGQGRAASR